MVSGFLIADADETARQRQRLVALAGTRPRVGIAWRSANAEYGDRKSLNLADLAPVLQRHDVLWVDLQYGDTEAERTAFTAASGVEIWHDPAVDPLADLDAAAGQMAALDLVISTSNTAVHLAAALGVPVWLLLPAPGYGLLWYWSVSSSNCPFYPTLRSFRQGAGAEGWSVAIAEVSRALGEWRAGRA